MPKKMSDNIKLEVAVEIMATKIANTVRQGYDENTEEMKLLLKEKKEMYDFNIKTIEKIISVYGPEVKIKKGKDD